MRRTTTAPVEAGVAHWAQALRAAGVSEKLIGDLAAAEFERRWQKRMFELQKQAERGDVDPEILTRQALQYEDEHEHAMRAVLSDESFRQWDRARVLAEFEMADVNLSSFESDALYQLRRHRDQQRRESERARQNGDLDEMDCQQKLDDAQKEYARQLKELLGEERYLTSLNPIDPERANLRQALKNLSLEETQAAALLQAHEDWKSKRARLDLQHHEGALDSASYEEHLKAADAARESEYQRLLGTNGLAQLQKAQDGRFQMLKRHAANWGFEDADINYLYDAIRIYENSVRDYQQQAQAAEQQGEQVDWPAVQKSIQDFAQQTERILEDSLGPERFHKLKRNNLLGFQSEGH